MAAILELALAAAVLPPVGPNRSAIGSPLIGKGQRVEEAPFPGDTEPTLLPPAAREGLGALYAGNLATAEAAFRRARDAAPSDPAGPYGLALVAWWRVFLSRGNAAAVEACDGYLKEALSVAEKVRPRSPRSAFYKGRVYATRAQLRLQEKRWMAAAQDARRMRSTFNKVLKQQPDLTDAALWPGLYDLFADRAPGAVKVLGFFFFLPRGNEQRGLRRLQQAAAGPGPFATEAKLYQVGVQYWAKNDPAAAVDELEALAARFPSNGYLHLFLAYGRLEAFGDAAGAHFDLSRAIKLAGNETLLLWSARMMDARVALLAGLVPEALADLQALEDRPPEMLADQVPQAFILRGHIEGQLGEVERSRQTLERVLANPAWSRFHGAARSERSRPHDQLEAEIFRANLEGQRQAASGHREAARESLEAVLARYPDNPQTRYRLAEMDLASGRYGEAAAAFEAVAREEPEKPTWLAPWSWVKAGWCHDALDNRQAAEAAYRDALQYKHRYDEGAVRAAERFLRRPYRRPPASVPR
ncbi:MAG: tetratricopeptide repeat protein [Acidobacteriota bacterium]